MAGLDNDPGESGFIYTFSDIAKNIQIKDRKTFKNWKWDLVKKKQGREDLFEKKSLHKAISDNSYKYLHGIESPCKYDRLPEYLTIEQCAEMLGLKDGRQFRRNYIDYNPGKLEGVEILKIGSTVRVEKESFELFVKTGYGYYKPTLQHLTFEDCAEMLGIKTRQFRNTYFNKKIKGQGVKILRIGSVTRIDKESFLSFLEKSGIEYKVPEYLYIKQCAKMLGISPIQFRKNYISNNKLESEGVKILKSGLIHIEKESFLRFLEKSGGEKAK